MSRINKAIRIQYYYENKWLERCASESFSSHALYFCRCEIRPDAMLLMGILDSKFIEQFKSCINFDLTFNLLADTDNSWITMNDFIHKVIPTHVYNTILILKCLKIMTVRGIWGYTMITYDRMVDFLDFIN